MGHAYSALYAQRKANGAPIVLRIEDIDQTRCREEFVSALFEDLAWIGVKWRPEVRRQSEHFDEYASRMHEIESMGLAYPCFCTRADIRREHSNAMAAPHGPEGPLYPGTCSALSSEERADRIGEGEPFAIRLDMERALAMVGELVWEDEHLGQQVARPQEFGDVVLARKETPASYHLCVTVDDALQNIDIVTRGEDLLRSTDVHRLIQAVLGLPTPVYSHHRLILDESGRKFSKRDASVTLRSLRESGESPDSVRQRLEFGTS